MILYICIVLVVLMCMPFALVGISHIHFLHIHVPTYWDGAIYLGTSFGLAVVLTIVLLPLTNKLTRPTRFFFTRFIGFSFVYYVADFLVDRVSIPIYMIFLFACVNVLMNKQS